MSTLLVTLKKWKWLMKKKNYKKKKKKNPWKSRYIRKNGNSHLKIKKQKQIKILHTFIWNYFIPKSVLFLISIHGEIIWIFIREIMFILRCLCKILKLCISQTQKLPKNTWFLLSALNSIGPLQGPLQGLC